MKLPQVNGSNLLRQKIVFPRDFAGEKNLVFIAFLRHHQDHVDEWVPLVAQLSQAFPTLSYYEFPTLSRRGVLYRTFLNEGMRAGIPSDETRARTITLYLDKAAFRSALQINSEERIWLYLFDQAGEVLWRVDGRVTDEKYEALRAAVARE